MSEKYECRVFFRGEDRGDVIIIFDLDKGMTAVNKKDSTEILFCYRRSGYIHEKISQEVYFEDMNTLLERIKTGRIYFMPEEILSQRDQAVLQEICPFNKEA
jgi:hypothetical protein